MPCYWILSSARDLECASGTGFSQEKLPTAKPCNAQATHFIYSTPPWVALSSSVPYFTSRTLTQLNWRGQAAARETDHEQHQHKHPRHLTGKTECITLDVSHLAILRISLRIPGDVSTTNVRQALAESCGQHRHSERRKCI